MGCCYVMSLSLLKKKENMFIVCGEITEKKKK